MLAELPTLTTNRLLLRPLQISDAESLYAVIAASRKEFSHWFVWAETSTLDSVRENLRQSAEVMALGRGWHFALCHPESGTILGRASFTEIDPGILSAELGYWLRTGYEGRGVMTEALQALLAYAFHPGSLHRVAAYADVENAASQRVLEKLGFQKQGLLRDMVRHPARGWRDHYSYVLTGQEQFHPAGGAVGR